MNSAERRLARGEVSDVGALKVTDNTSDRPGRIAARRVTSPPNFSNNRNLSLD